MLRKSGFRNFIHLVMAFGLALSGCSLAKGLKQPSHPISYFTIDYPEPLPVTSKPLAGVILIRRIQVAAEYGTDRLVVQPSLFSKEFYYYNRWAVNPAPMVTDYLFRDLISSKLFTAVLGGPGYLLPEYEISGTLDSFQLAKTKKGWEAEVTINILLFPHSPGGTRDINKDKIIQKRYEAKVPCPANTPEAIVAGLSRGMQQVSIELLEDLKGYFIVNP